MKKIYLILLILPFCFSANAQKFIKIEDKTFNWGGKVGVNAALPIVKSLTIDNQEMEDIRLQYTKQLCLHESISIVSIFNPAWHGNIRKVTYVSTYHRRKTACLTGQTPKCLSARTGLLISPPRSKFR